MCVTSMLDRGAGRLLALGFILSLAAAPLAGCVRAGEESAEQPAPAAAEKAAPKAAEAGGEHVHGGGGGDTPSRAEEMARDEFSRPQEVFDYLGIAPGSTVVDINAGFGYNTYLLSERVGPSGRVYAERGSDPLIARMQHGDLAGRDNITIPESWAAIPDASVDAVLAVREYHLINDYEGFLASLLRTLKPGGVVGVIEVRLNQPTGHDMSTHRMGEQTIIEQFEAAGFELAGESDLLRRDDDDYTTRSGPFNDRTQTDRMLLKFARPR